MDEENSPFADNTKFCSIVLDVPGQFGSDTNLMFATLPNGEQVVFWQLIPICESELMLARTSGSDSLFEKLGDITLKSVDITREVVV
jgi:hypothetical protein